MKLWLSTPDLAGMENDLSLSKSFGGLRIANPDDAEGSSPKGERTETSLLTTIASVSPAVSPGIQQESRRSPSPVSPVSPVSPELDSGPSDLAPSKASYFDQPSKPAHPAAYDSPQPSNGARDRLSMSQNHHIQSPQQYPGVPVTATSHRPSSTIYPQPPSGASVMRAGSYRLRSDSSRSSLSTAPHRTSSRNSASAMQAGVPTREGSHSERAYGQSRQSSTVVGNGPMPPRTSSRNMNGALMKDPGIIRPTSGIGSPYGVEGGPLGSSEEWKDRGAAMGFQRDVDREGNAVIRSVKKGVKDFTFGRTLGEGSYSTVMAATDRQTLREYAIKVLDKKHIIKEKKVKYVNIEKDTLNRLTDHPGVVRLYYTFQDERSLYFVLDVATGGELLGVLKRMTTFDEDCTRFYGAQILDTIDYMHSRGVIHRDLKPENVLLDDAMHVKITDFGTAKILDPPKPRARDDGSGIPFAGSPMDGADTDRAVSFVGTAEYVSPELLRDKNACKASDLWAFGCIIYQLLAGRPPFKGGNEYQTFQKICNLEYEFPPGFPPVARDLVERLLVLEPEQRLPIEHIKNHEFFDGIKWGRGLWNQKPPRLRSHAPSSQENLIKLNGGASSRAALKPAMSANSSSHAINGSSRSHPRVVTELAPPSQLDIEWSPVLTRNNERILKLGSLIVTVSAPSSHSPMSKDGLIGAPVLPEPNRKLSRFFGGNTTKKKQRLVMVTSGARIILAAASGEEKKAKTEVSLAAPGTGWGISKDGKGIASWSIQTVSSLLRGSTTDF